ncbi:Putative GTP-binding and tetratricopeptide repeat-containing protein (plasmid) [Candidatus Megaera polyxenophila]|nr:Putative GTP-binding and tetratricopeptide repeat-containing protein [Candidatus Megaera polyxenophila]
MKQNSTDIPKLQWLIKSGYANISNNKIEQSVLVVGDTGNGKSTLVNALTDKRLESHFVKKGMKGSYVINLSSDEQGATIGATAVSETTIPKSWFDQKSKIVYWDCPGFEDTKGVEQDIANGFFIKQIFDNSEMVKILLVTSENQITSDRCAVFLRLTQKLASMFKDIDKVAGGISLVVTKAGEGVDPQGVREELMLVKKDHESSKESSTFKDPNLKKLFDTIISPKSKIGIFYTPTKEGLLSKNLEFCKSIVNIKDAVNGSSYIYKPEINIPISDKSKVAIHGVYDYEKQDLSNVLTKLFLDIQSISDHYVYKDLALIIKKLYSIQNEVNLHKFDNYYNYMETLCSYIKNPTIKKQDYSIPLEMIGFCKIILTVQDKISSYAYENIDNIEYYINDCIKKKELEEIEKQKQKKIQEERQVIDLDLAETDYKIAEAAYNNKNYSKAYSSIQGALKTFEKYNKSTYIHYEFKGRCEINLDYSNSSIDESFENAASKVTNPEWVIIKKARTYFDCNKYSQADKALEEAISRSSSSDDKASMYNEFGCKYYNNKSYSKAKDYFYQAYLKTSDPIKEAIYKDNQGDALYCLAQYEDALSSYKMALDKQPNNETYKENTAKTYNALGNQYHNNKSYHTAIEYYDKANEIKPDSLYKENKANSYDSLGCQYYNKHTKDGYTDAKYYFQKAYDISSDSSKYGKYRQNRDDAQSQLDKCIIFMVKIEYDNPILNYPEIIKTLTNNLSMNYFEVIDKVSTFDRDFVREVCLSGNVELLQECFEL